MGNYAAYSSYKDSGVEWLGKIPEHWSVRHVKRLADIAYGVGGEIDRSLTEGVNLLSLPNVKTDGTLVIDDTGFCDINNSEKEKVILEKGDLLFNWRNGSSSHLGKTAYFDLEGEWTHVSFLLRLRFDLSESDSRYFQHMLNGLKITGFFMVSKAGVNNTFNLYELSNLKIICPPLDEQRAIAAFLDYKTQQIDQLIAKKEALLEKLDEKRTALISHAVTKGLDPTVPMKDSGVEWLGEIPEYWETISIKRVFDIRDGTHETPQYIYESEDSVPLITSKDFEGDSIIFENAKHISLLDHQAISRRSKVDCGDVLMSMIGANIGKSLIVKDDREFSIKNVALFKANNNLELSKLLLYYFSSGLLHVQISLKNRGGAQGFLSLSDIRNLVFVNIPVFDRKKIVDYLDQKTAEIDQQKAKILQAIDLLKEYRTALITNAVTGKIDVLSVPIPTP